MTQNLIVGLIVVFAALYAVWRWMPNGWRRNAASMFAAGTHKAGLVDAQRAEALAASLGKASGCGACDTCGACGTGKASDKSAVAGSTASGLRGAHPEA